MRSARDAWDVTIERLRRVAWIVILIVDIGFIAWGVAAAASPDHLLGPRGNAILPAAYEGYSGASWSELAEAFPVIAGYMAVLFRMYGIYCALFGLMGSAIAATAFRRGEHWAWWTLLVGNTIALVSAMRYDWIVNAIGPFELTEYIGLAAVWGALAVTARFPLPDGLIGLAGSWHGRDEGNPRHRLSESEENARDVETHRRRAGPVGARRCPGNLGGRA